LGLLTDIRRQIDGEAEPAPPAPEPSPADKPARIRRYRVTLVDGRSFTALATTEQDEAADRIEFELHWGTRLLLLERVS